MEYSALKVLEKLTDTPINYGAITDQLKADFKAIWSHHVAPWNNQFVMVLLEHLEATGRAQYQYPHGWIRKETT